MKEGRNVESEAMVMVEETVQGIIIVACCIESLTWHVCI